jgi:hypothetical protein
MGKFDAELKAAKKIGEDWIKKAEGYTGSYATLKKEHLKLEKGILKNIQDAVQRKDANLDTHLRELDACRDFLNTYKKEGERLEKDFDAWALREPRKNMGFIAEKLKLGAPTDEAYKEVAAGLKTLLTNVATAISTTQKAWRTDLEIALNNHLDKVDTLEKIIKGEVGKTKGFLDQLDKGIERFAQECGTTYGALKVDVFVRDVEEIMNGKMAEQPKVKIEQKYHLTQERIALVPKLRDQIDKNYNRVIKSVPPEVINGFVGKGAKAKLDKARADIDTKMTHALKVFESAKKSYESKKLV